MGIRHSSQYISQLVIWIQRPGGVKYTQVLSNPIIYKRLDNRNNKDQDLKVKIHHLTLTTMLQYKCPF